MFCPKCHERNLADSESCVNCYQDTSYFRRHLFVGSQFVFVRADSDHPMAIEVDSEIQTMTAPAIFSRHQHSIRFGDLDESPDQGLLSRISRRLRESKLPAMPDITPLSPPSLTLAALVSDRKIYQPNDDAILFMVAPDAGGQEANLEVKMAGQKVYEAKVTLNKEGLAQHRYGDLKEGEYTALLTLAKNKQVKCSFSAAEYTLSPLIATLEEHALEQQALSFTLKIQLLSRPFSGPVELGLQCGVCGNRVVATQKVTASNGSAQGGFNISGHGGPFHVQVITEDGNSAMIAFPGSGAKERQRIEINGMGQTAEMGLLPWQGAEPVRGFYVGTDEMAMTPLMLEDVVSSSPRLKAASDIALAKVVSFNPRTGEQQVIDARDLVSGQEIGFESDAPYTLFTAASLLSNQERAPFEGWGVVIKPLTFEASLTTPKKTRPGEEIDVIVEIPPAKDGSPVPAFCWLLAYDVRLEHESPLPKLAKQIYKSVRNAGQPLSTQLIDDALTGFGQDRYRFGMSAGATIFEENAVFNRSGPKRSMASMAPPPMAPAAAPMGQPQAAATAVDMPVMVMAPTRMEFPELAFQELFHFAGTGARTVRLGDQIGTWRVRAYIFRGVDYQELTADIQSSKPVYAELDLPAIASEGDEIQAAVDYFAPETAELTVATSRGEKRVQVSGSGRESFFLRGPGRVELLLKQGEEQDMSVRHVAPPGVQKVTASRLRILDRGETAAGEKVVVYASVGQVLKETITALTDYPFG